MSHPYNLRLNFHQNAEHQTFLQQTLSLLLLEFQTLLLESKITVQEDISFKTTISKDDFHQSLIDFGCEVRMTGPIDWVAYQLSEDGKSLEAFFVYRFPKHGDVKVIRGLLGGTTLQKSEKFKALLLDKNEAYIEKKCTIDWTYKTPHGLESMTFVEDLNDEFHVEAYPYLENLEERIQSFLDSSATVLILMGEAGTGKTQLLREIVRKMQQEEMPHILYSSDQGALSSDEIFIDFRRGNYDVLILEDIDFNLRNRTDDNTIMPRFLNASDGFIKGGQRSKIIFTTNILDVNKIDSALIRAGRCFGVWKFKRLNQEQAIQFGKKLGVKAVEFTEMTYSLADIYRKAGPAKQYHSPRQSRIGFNGYRSHRDFEMPYF